MDYMKYITIQVIKKSERSEVVFAAMDEMDVPVVVKRLQGANPEIYKEIAKLRNPHIPRIYCMEEQGDELCIAEEYIDGRTLDVYLAEETLTDLQKLELMVQLCEALEVLHQCNPPVIHRDIKPSNILITTDGVLKIIDFDASRQYKVEKDTGDTRLLGTVEYAAPEQFGYAQTDVRSDIYSVGVVFNEIKIEKEASFAGIWKRLVDKCTSFDPENRYKSVTDLKKDLLKCIERAKYPLWKRAVVTALAAGVLFIMLVAGGIQQYREKEKATSGKLPENPTIQVEGDGKPLTENPYATEDLQPTEAPELPATQKFVTKPEEVTDWYIPPVRKGYIDDNGEYKVGKRVVGDKTEKAGYAFDKLKHKDSRDVSWKLNDNAAITMNFDRIYGQAVFELPDVFDMNYCNRLVVYAKNEIGDIAIVLYNEEYEELEHLYWDKTEGAREFTFYPKTKETVEYIGFMANDGELADYSGFETMINYVDFYMVNPESSKISYDMTDLKMGNYYFLNWIRWEIEGKGSLSLNYNHAYGEMQLMLPEPVDMRQCDGVSVVMDTGGEAFTVKLFDEEMNELGCGYDHITNGREEELLDVSLRSKVYGIGLMLDEVDGRDGTEQKNSVVTVQSINFYMKPGYEKEL